MQTRKYGDINRRFLQLPFSNAQRITGWDKVWNVKTRLSVTFSSCL